MRNYSIFTDKVSAGGKTLVLLLAAVASTASMTACSQTSFSADNVSGAPPADTQTTQIKSMTADFVSDLEGHQYAQAETLMTNKFKARLPVNKLSEAAQSGNYVPLIGSSDWEYSSFQNSDRLHRIISHCSFHGVNGLEYHTNIVVSGSGSTLAIDNVVPPLKPRKPVASGTTAAKPPV